jgi:hypothetical protein
VKGRHGLTVIRHVTNYSERYHQKVCAMKPGPEPSSGTAMTHAERQPSFACSVARYRAKQADGAPTLRYRKPVDRRSRVQQWRDAVAEPQALQSEYRAWLDAMPQNMADSGTAEAFIAICNLELSNRRVSFTPGVWPRLNCCTM